MNKTIALVTLIALLLTLVASSLVVEPELIAFVPSLEHVLTGNVKNSVRSLLANLLHSFLGMGDISGPLAEVLIAL